ncbi:phosphatidylserine lipase ABHD16A-like [Corticium candelabrum]|uniref:phosphatidylserine lipase ABHD16A-like n=1 Tax=Corticium candelabrum TaxID=121492 RepID=UPI002E271FC8|nr:phosphatidylserine lipase ABHD16A-like [Corticium candelabrum]
MRPFTFIFGPRLHFVFTKGRTQHQEYAASATERISDSIIQWTSRAWSVLWYSSPLILFYLWKKGAFTVDALSGWLAFSKVLGGISVIITGAFCIRGVGRRLNPYYCLFVDTLASARKGSVQARLDLANYDFDFDAWPIDFSWKESTTGGDPTKSSDRKLWTNSGPRMSSIASLPRRLLMYVVAHVVGRRAMYPGSTAILQKLIAPHLVEGRCKLFSEYGGLRAKLCAEDGNEIDSMFVDQRGKAENGNKLVICSEGNAAFYEVGCMNTPLGAGYSVLGWNHPGFACSTGLPFPQAEKHAIDVVVRYAVDRLGFKLEDIVLFSWSIGGFASTYAAMIYPDISAVILDATFDDITPLAVSRMPASISNLAESTVLNYLHLNNADQLCEYPGPVLVIRRIHDEMISIVPQDIKTNLGNRLLTRLLSHRYPNVFDNDTKDVVEEYLNANEEQTQIEISQRVGGDMEWCVDALQEHVADSGAGFPCDIGQSYDRGKKELLALYLIRHHLIDFAASHCDPFPHTSFRLPWSLGAANG